MKKKLLSLLMALCLVVTLLPVSALAADDSADAEANTTADAEMDTSESFSEEENSETAAAPNEADEPFQGAQGEGTKENPYLINDLAALKAFRDSVNGGNSYHKKFIKLNADIDLENEEWTPIGKEGMPFSGTFDGNEKTISNLSINMPSKHHIGLFGYTTSGEVKNFTLHNAKVSGSQEVGAVAGTPHTSKYTNITVTGLIQVNGFSYVGGAFGKNAYDNLTNVDVTGDIGSYVEADSVEDGTGYRTYLGGLAGFMGEGNITISDCDVKIDVTGSTCDVGGILGILHYGNTMTNCTYEGSLTLTNPDEDDGAQFGALTGTVMNVSSKATITNCTATVTKAMSGERDVTNSITPHGDFYYKSDKNNTGDVSISATVNGNSVTVDNSVAKVEQTSYKTLAEAVNAAKNGGTVELLQNVTIDTWNQVWNTKDLTINGNGHTVTVKKIESKGNGDYLFYGAENLNVSNLTVNLPAGDSGFSMVSGKLDSVTVNGGVYAVATGAAPEGQQVVIKNCTFTVQSGMAIYTQENGNAANTVIDGCTFNSERAVILRNNEQFTNNTVKGSAGVTIANSATATVTDNTFTEDSRLKVYNTESTIERNKLLGNVVLDESVPENNNKISLDKNYWGEGRTPSSVLGEDASKVDGGKTEYYVRPSMKEEDLNTYVPPVVDQGGSYEPSGDYLVSVDKTTGGKVTVNPGRADKGDTVTITVKPDKGYELDSLTVTAKNGDTIKLTEKSSNKFTFKMPGSKVTVEAVFVKENSEKPVVTLPFADVTTGDWFYDAVAYVYGNDLMNGTSATAFSPYLTTSRAMMLTMLARYDGVDTTTGSTWYEAGAVWAVAEGISDGTNLEADLTREQLVTMLWRYTGSPVVESGLSAYPDGASVSDWAVNAMIWATQTGVITGNGAGALAPQGAATRAEVATILARFCAGK